MGVTRILVLLLRGVFRNRAELAAENLALRQELAILQQKSKTPRLRRRDRIFWVCIPKTLSGVFRARGAGVFQQDIVDAADASDGFRVDSVLNPGRRADRSP